jgi:hypothetical protein
MVSFLIADRANVNKANNKGCAAQQRARRAGVLRRLFCSGSLIDISGSLPCRYTALHCAAVNGHTNAAVPLLVGGADETIKNKDGLILGGYVQAHV